MGYVEDMRLSRPAFLDWLEECWAHGFRHGEELTLALRLTDNVREADETLRLAEERGLITSMGCAPTLQQKFFGIGGMRWDSKPAVLKSWAWHRSTHGWTATDAAVRLLQKAGRLKHED